MQKDSAQAKISLKVVGGLLFLTHPVDSLSGWLLIIWLGSRLLPIEAVVLNVSLQMRPESTFVQCAPLNHCAVTTRDCR